MVQAFREVALIGVGVILGGVLAKLPLHLRDPINHIFFGATLIVVWVLVEVVARTTRKEIERERGDRQ